MSAWLEIEPAEGDHSLGRHGSGRSSAPSGAGEFRRAAPPRQATNVARAGKRQGVRLGLLVLCTGLGGLAAVTAYSITNTTYAGFRDEAVARLVAQQAELQTAYEDRLAEMRAQVDRVMTNQLLDHEQVGQKLEQVLRRQSVIEQRASALGALGDTSFTGSTKAGTRPARINEPTTARSKPGRDAAGTKPPADRRARLGPSGPAPAVAANAEVEDRLFRVAAALDRVEQRQAAALVQMGETYDAKLRRIRSLLAEVGIGSGKAAEAGTGGPFVPVKTLSQESFQRQIHRIESARAQLDRLQKTLVALPIRRPVSGQIDMSSNFGVRMDPFMNRPAFHTGIDFRGEIGEAVRATGSGQVVSAGWSGGYGRMVEIDHGYGLTTRYGHLQDIVVQVGQVVKSSQVVGRMGSTGRSTGPHLHYETRVDGDAVDPQKFLRAGLRFGSL